MSAAAVLLLVPHVVLLPPEAPAELAPVAETCAQAVSASRDLRVTRLGATGAPGAAVADRFRAELDGAVLAYRELRFRDAKERAERVVAALEAEASGAGDFDLLLRARLRLALTHLAQRRQAPARALLEAAARQAPDAQITDADWPPNLVAAWEAARAAVAGEPAAPLGVTVQTSIAFVPPRTWVDGRAVSGASPSLPPGDHVLVATAPGHETRRQVVRVPAVSPLTIILPATLVVPEDAVVLATTLEGSAGRVRVTVRRQGGGEATRETDVAGAPSAAREMAETLAGVPRAVAAAGSGQGQGGAGGGAGAGPGSGGGGGGGGGSGRTESGGGSVFGRWWFWTIVGGVVTVGLVAAVAANHRDPGTDVHVGVAP
jgi:hypothetical protein